MDDKALEPIVSRVTRLNQLILGKSKNNKLDFHAVSRDGLLDALFALYGECNTSHMKKDPNVAAFVEKFQGLMAKLQSLRVNISDFEVKKIIGRGNFGEVQVVREKATGDVYAMKVLHKAETLAHQCVAFYEEERDIMAKSASPWITKLQYAFQDAHNLYLIMEFHAGGDMLSLLEKTNVLSEDTARFYLAELVLAINSVHNMGYVHRDIKPDNILIDITGHIKLADFGSSSKLNDAKMVTSKMPVGTPDYIAPEVLVSINDEPNSPSGYGVMCDWWSLGIVAYEMLYGVTPFANEKLLVVYNNIMNFKESLEFPDEAENNSEAFLNMIKSLLSEADQRLDYEQLINHPVFAQIDWNNIRQRPPPFVPVVTSQDDTSNFDEFEHDARPLISNLASKPEFSGKNLPFVGFTYTSPFASLVERLSSADSFNSPSRRLSEVEVNSKKKELSELQITIAELRSSEDNLKAENQKLWSMVKKKEKRIEKVDDEVCRLENQITALQSDKKELKRLLQLEREDRVLTERKASQILKCIKRKRKRNLLAPHYGNESGEQDDDSPSPLSDQLNEVLESIDELDSDGGPVMKTTKRAKSLSPYTARIDMSRMNTEVNILKYEEAQAKIRDLQQMLHRLKDENEKILSSIKVFENESRDFEHELKTVSKERDDALAKIELLKKAVVKLEVQVYKYQHEEENADDLSTSEITDIVGDLQNDIDMKNKLISKLKLQITRLEQKCLELELTVKEDKDKIMELISTKEELEAKLKSKVEETLARDIEMAETKQNLTNLHCDLQMATTELQRLRENEEFCQLTTVEQSQKEHVLERENAVLKARITELESEIKSFEDIEPLPDSTTMSPKKSDIESSGTEAESTKELDKESSVAVMVTDTKRDQENVFLIQENERLKAKITELEKKAEEASNCSRTDDTKYHFSKQLMEKDEMLSDLKLDLRVAQREKKKAEDLLAIMRENSRELKDKLAETEKLLVEKEKCEAELKDKISILEQEVSWKKRDISEKVKMYETQKDINKIFVQTQDQFQEVSKQNEKLKTDYSMNENEKSQMSSELETVKRELAFKKQECDKLEKVVAVLQVASTDLEEQLQDFEDLVSAREDELKTAASENSKIKQEVISLEGQLKIARSEYSEEKKFRMELEKQIEEFEEDLESQQSIHEAEIQSLQDMIQHQKSVIDELEVQITQMEHQILNYDQDMNVHVHKSTVLEEELVRLKEETAEYITQIASLKSSNLKLTQQLDHAVENIKEMDQVIDQLNNDLESADATFNHEKVKLQETLCQQSKLIDFLQTKTETMEKRKKTLTLPRLFGGKKESTVSFSQTCDEELEREKTRCRRLQDQLSQCRAENMALRNQLSQSVPKTPITERSKSSIPASPMSRAVHLALTASPTVNGDQESPLMVTRETSRKIKKLQGMTHRIPHRFVEMLCMRGFKCVACLDSIHFGRRAVRCQECSAVCHSKCAWSLPKTCGLPSGFVQHFQSEVSKNPTVQVTAEVSSAEPEGWVKVPKINKQGWERRYLRIIGSTLYFYEDSEDKDTEKAVDHIDFSDANGEIIVISAVSAAELTGAAKSDLPFVLKVEYRPFTTCWPSRCVYIMTHSFADKQMWVATLESLVDKYKAEHVERAENKLSGQVILKLKGDAYLDVLCTLVLTDDILLLGAMEGLFVVFLSNQVASSLKYNIEGIDSVYQMARVDSVGVMVLISGTQRTLSVIKLAALTSWINNAALPPVEINVITDAKGCHLFAVQESDSSCTPYLCSATADIVTLYRWDDYVKIFCKKKVSKTQEPCSCIHFTKSSVILGCDKFFEMDLQTFNVQEFLDRTDSSLACLVYGVPQFQSFPISIFLVSPNDQPEEYLVCFHELGVFVDGFGQRTRQDDMKWSRLPLAFAYRAPYLFMTHFNSIEVIEILPCGKSENATRGVLKVPSPQYLGPATVSGAIYISTSQDRTVEILCIEGDSAKSRVDVVSDSNETNSRVPSPTSKGSEGDPLDFSFSNSLLQSLDSPSGDQLSVSSTSDTRSSVS